jgi:hypothetical protein
MKSQAEVPKLEKGIKQENSVNHPHQPFRRHVSE